MSDTGRFIRTVRHLRPGQIFWRARYALRRRLGLHPRPPLLADAPVLDAAVLDRLASHVRVLARHAPPQAAALAELREGRFSFLHETRACGADGSPPWRAPDAVRLWLYHLHYFEYARTFALARAAGTGDPGDGARLLAWMHDWIRRNPPGTDVAWDAFPLSARLLHWLAAESVFRFNDPLLRQSIHQQSVYLLRCLEYDNRANHLFKNAVALVAAGAALGGTALGDVAQRRGMALMEQEVREQILADGGHYERSPMYHALVLEDALIAHAVCHAPWLAETARRMAAFLEAVLHPDGEIPLFNDAALGVVLPAKALVAVVAAECGDADASCGRSPDRASGATEGLQEICRLKPVLQNSPSCGRSPDRATGPTEGLPRGCAAFPDSGFYVMGRDNGAGRMIVKAGPPGPDYQPAHAHADLFTFEFSIGAARVIVDSGVHGYAGSPWREYCRSTRAHNTVCVSERDQMEMWAVFRVGRRARPQTLEWTVSEEGALLRVRHDGYRPVLHERCFHYDRQGCWGVADRLIGDGGPATSFLHFHPDAVMEESGDCWRVGVGDAQLRVYCFGIAETRRIQGEAQPCQGWYCPEFGLAIPAPTLALTPESPARTAFGYVIVPDMPDGFPDSAPEVLLNRLRNSVAAS